MRNIDISKYVNRKTRLFYDENHETQFTYKFRVHRYLSPAFSIIAHIGDLSSAGYLTGYCQLAYIVMTIIGMILSSILFSRLTKFRKHLAFSIILLYIIKSIYTSFYFPGMVLGKYPILFHVIPTASFIYPMSLYPMFLISLIITVTMMFILDNFYKALAFSCNCIFAYFFSLFIAINLENILMRHYIYNLKINKKEKRISIIKKNIQNVLVELLPEKILHDFTFEKKELSYSIANGSVAFIKFTSTNELIYTLDVAASLIDTIIEDVGGIIKVKMIDNMFLLVSGINGEQDHIHRCIYLYQRLNRYIHKYTNNSCLVFCGIAFGSFMEGSGLKMSIAYDVFGNPVNLASRICSQCEVNYQNGKNNLSLQNLGGSCYIASNDWYGIDKIDIKSEGTYTLKGINGEREIWSIVSRVSKPKFTNTSFYRKINAEIQIEIPKLDGNLFKKLLFPKFISIDDEIKYNREQIMDNRKKLINQVFPKMMEILLLSFFVCASLSSYTFSISLVNDIVVSFIIMFTIIIMVVTTLSIKYQRRDHIITYIFATLEILIIFSSSFTMPDRYLANIWVSINPMFFIIYFVPGWKTYLFSIIPVISFLFGSSYNIFTINIYGLLYVLTSTILAIFYILLYIADMCIIEHNKRHLFINKEKNQRIIDVSKKYIDNMQLLLSTAIPKYIIKEHNLGTKVTSMQSLKSLLIPKSEVTAVICADIVNFTANSLQHTPKEIVSTLEMFFISFEEICCQHGFHHIKSIGDAFIFVFPNHKNDSRWLFNVCRSIIDATKNAEMIWPMNNNLVEIRIGGCIGLLQFRSMGKTKISFEHIGNASTIANKLSAGSFPWSIKIGDEVGNVLYQT